MTNATVMMTEALTDEMEVIEYNCSFTPETSQKDGERIARKYRAMGWACECIGVVAMVKAIGFQEETDERIPNRFGMVKRATRTEYIDQTVYHPVIFPKPPTIEDGRPA
jgi:hypothetical protein